LKKSTTINKIAAKNITEIKDKKSSDKPGYLPKKLPESFKILINNARYSI